MHRVVVLMLWFCAENRRSPKCLCPSACILAQDPGSSFDILPGRISIMAKKNDGQSKRVRSVKGKARALPKFLRNVVPDSIDLRDRPYIPSIKIIPAEVFAPKVDIPILNQR